MVCGCTTPLSLPFGGGQFEMYNLNGYIQALKDEEAWVRAVAALALGKLVNLRSRTDKSLYNENHVVRMGIARTTSC